MANLVEIDQQEIIKDAEEWATVNGLKGPFRLDGPDRQDFPKRGYGYVVQVREQGGKQRMVTLRYTNDGKRSFWQMDGMITG